MNESISLPFNSLKCTHVHYYDKNGKQRKYTLQLSEISSSTWGYWLRFSKISALCCIYTLFFTRIHNIWLSPQIFLTSGRYFSNFLPAFYSRSQICFKINISWYSQKYWTKSQPWCSYKLYSYNEKALKKTSTKLITKMS